MPGPTNAILGGAHLLGYVYTLVLELDKEATGGLDASKTIRRPEDVSPHQT